MEKTSAKAAATKDVRDNYFPNLSEMGVAFSFATGPFVGGSLRASVLPTARFEKSSVVASNAPGARSRRPSRKRVRYTYRRLSPTPLPSRTPGAKSRHQSQLAP
ncbi:hypothetical protein MMAN_54930 [Mycobacterium mantenii]|uniref:Uncharacterized protein n=1 Tax=Mycobacterium mantenii TaxID=560555 RepID=A0ABM7K0K2_MYCNT|nr:hypothetical protein MMAN_54930 [Mycobacterium mantenii]